MDFYTSLHMHILYVCAYQPNSDSLSQDDYSTFTAIKKQQATKKKNLIAKTKKKKDENLTLGEIPC